MKRLALLSIGVALAAYAGLSNPKLTLTSTGTSVSGQIGAGIRHIVSCDAAARIAYGRSDVAATATSMKLAADEKWEDKTTAGIEYIAVISVSGTANCYVYVVSL